MSPAAAVAGLVWGRVERGAPLSLRAQFLNLSERGTNRRGHTSSCTVSSGGLWEVTTPPQVWPYGNLLAWLLLAPEVWVSFLRVFCGLL